MAEPVFEVLSRMDKWDFYDIRVFVVLVDYYSPNFEQVDYQADIILQKLEDYSHEERYPYIKSALHMNMLLRLVRIKYSLDIDTQDIVSMQKLEQTFLKHYEEIMNFDGLVVRKAAAKIRRGRFFKDQSLIDEGFKALEELGENNWITQVKQEFSEFDRDEKNADIMNDLRAVIGKNFKKAREARGLTKKEIALYIFKTVHDITLVEEGRKMLSRNDLRRAAGFMGVPIVDFLDDDIEISNNSHAALYRKRCEHEILGCLAKMSNDEMDLIRNTAKAVVNLNVSPNLRLPEIDWDEEYFDEDED